MNVVCVPKWSHGNHIGPYFHWAWSKALIANPNSASDQQWVSEGPFMSSSNGYADRCTKRSRNCAFLKGLFRIANGATLVPRLCLLVQLLLIQVNGVGLQYQTPLCGGGDLFYKVVNSPFKNRKKIHANAWFLLFSLSPNSSTASGVLLLL